MLQYRLNGDTEKGSYYASIRHRMILTVIIVSLTPMILVTGMILYQFNTYSNQMVHAHIGELVLKHKQTIDYFLFEKLSNIRYLFRSSQLPQFQKKAFLNEQLQILREEYSTVFVDLGLIDQTGRQVTYAGPFGLEQADYSQSEWFRQAIQQRHFMSDVFLGLRGQPHFIVTVKRRWNDADWLLRATIDFVAFNDLVENLRVGKTGSALVINRAGEFQTRPPTGDLKLTRQQYLNLFDKGNVPRLPAADWPGPGALGQQTLWYSTPDDLSSLVAVEKVGESNKKIIILAAFLKNNEWLLIFQQDRDDAFAKLRHAQAIGALIFISGALGIIIMAMVLSNRMVNRIAKVDTEKDLMNQKIIETGKLVSIGELAAGIAHEINNPVAIMVEEAGWIQDLMDEGIDEEGNREEFERALRQIQNQGRRCKDITHKLLNFARMTDSRIQTVQLNEIIKEVIDLSSQKTRYDNVEIRTRLQNDLPTIRASVTEMQQVLMNIIHNALDAMEKTGGQIMITSEARNDHIYISIEDTGPGIRPGDIERLFDPFFTTKPVGKGTGLGLSICYGIIHKMGGAIEVESALGFGATFTITLPINNPLDAKTSAPQKKQARRINHVVGKGVDG